jgi:hypothetical protein
LKRRRFLPLDGLGPEYAERIAQFKVINENKKGQDENDDNYTSDILEYLDVHKKIELRIVDIMTDIADEMLKKLTNFPE